MYLFHFSYYIRSSQVRTKNYRKNPMLEYQKQNHEWTPISTDLAIHETDFR